MVLWMEKRGIQKSCNTQKKPEVSVYQRKQDCESAAISRLLIWLGRRIEGERREIFGITETLSLSL